MQPLSVRRAALVAIVLASAIAGAALVLADPISPIAITNADSPDPVSSGQQLTYTITMVNTGGSKLTELVMSDQLNSVGGIGVPPQLQITSTRGSCTQNANLVRCTTNQIEGNGSWVVTIRGLVNAANGTVINNTATVTGTRSAQNFTSTATTSTLVTNTGSDPLPDLSVNKAGPTTVAVNSPMTYTLTVNNTGTAHATAVKVIDTVPAGVTINTATGTSLFTCGFAGQTVTCTGGAINQGSNGTITITGTSPAAPTTLTNTAIVDPDNVIAESNELNNTSAIVNTQVTDTPAPGNFSIVKTDDPAILPGAGPDPVVPGGIITYKILVTNTSAFRADDVVIVDGTQGLVASTVQATQVITNGTVGTFGGCVVTAPEARCNIRSLNAGGTMLMTVSGEVIQSAGSSIFNTATVSGNIKNTGYSATDTERTTVKPAVDLTITKADSPDPVCAASWPGGPGYPAGPGAPVGPDYPAGNTCQGGLTYTFVVGNSGVAPLGATNVTVRDPLPAGVIFDHAVNVDGGGFGCAYDAPTNVVTCTGGTIPPESTKTLQFVVVAPPGLGPITNTVTVDPNNAIFEADETNNTFAQTTQIATGIDLTVSKHSNHEANFVATRGTLTYTIKVSNLGTQDSTNILVRDTLPADTIFRDAVSDPLHGFSCSQAGGIVDCITGHIQGTESMNYPSPPSPGTNVDTATITIRVFATAYEQAAMHNEVRVDPLNQIGEVNENNNLAVQNTKVDSGGVPNDAFNELTISKIQSSPDPTNTARNAVVTYIVKVGNDGTDPVVGVKVRDTLPAGAQYIEATGTNSFLCNQGAIGIIDCVGGQIAANTPTAAGATITIKAFAPDTPATYTNQVEVDPDHAIAEGNEFNNNASAQTIVKNAGAGSFHELSVTKVQDSPDKTNTARNAVVTFTITVTNSGSDAVNGVVVRDKLPAGSRYIQANNVGNQFLCTEVQTGIVDCVNGQVAGSGGTATITLKMFAPDTPGDYINQVNVDPDNDIPEGDEFNNQAFETTTVANGGLGDFNDLSISKTASPSPVKPNEVLTYTLTVSNTEGEAAALNVKVRDVLSSMVTFVSAVDLGGPGAFTCGESSLIVTCVGGTIPAGGSRTITIKVKAPNLVDVTLLNQAMVDPENEIPEGNEENNNFDLATQVSSNINLTIKKDGPHTSSQGQVSTYKLTIENQSPTSQGVGSDAGQTAFNVEVHDPLPVGLIPLSVDTGSNNNFQCQVLENPINLVDCIGDLNPDSPIEISIDVFMTAEGNRALDNEACIDPSDAIKEFSKPDGTLGETDNCSTHTAASGTPPKTSPNFLISKSVDQAVASPGETLDYTITVSNIGDADHKGLITVTDNLPDDTTAVDITGPNGWTCSSPADSMTCDNSGLSGDDQTLQIGASVQFTVHANVKPDANGLLVNGATVSNALADPGDTNAEDETAANQANNSAHATTSVGSPGIDLAIGTITDTPDPVNPGKQITYTVVAVNAGTSAQSNVHVKVTMPSGVSYVGADGSNGFNCDLPVGTLIDCHAVSMPAGGSTTITAKFDVLLSPPGTLTLKAHIDPRPGESNTLNNDQEEITTVSGSVCTSCVDIVSALLIASPEPVASGGTVTVKYVLLNTGDLPTTLSTDPADHQQIANFDFIANPTPGGAIASVSFAYSSPGITCSTAAPPAPASDGNHKYHDCFGNLGPGQSIIITATVTGVAGSNLFVQGNADPNNAQAEFSNSNNSLNQTVVINP